MSAEQTRINLAYITSLVVSKLPVRVQLFFGDIIGVLWFDILRIRRQVALDNLKKCFPNWTEAERVKIARASVCNVGRSFVEFLRIPSLEKKSGAAQFELIGEQHLVEALKKNRGVFLLSAHIGNGDWGNIGLALKGYKTHVITKKIKWARLNRFWFKIRMRFGAELISDRGSSIAILKALKRNGIVVFVLDQFLGPPIGIKTTFFGFETGTAMGLALLAGRAGAAVVPCYTYRKADGSTCIVCEEEIPYQQSANNEETIREMTQKYCDKIETWVRKHPDQWMWVHRRWKRFKV